MPCFLLTLLLSLPLVLAAGDHVTLDVTQAPWSADRSGSSDSTEALQRAFAEASRLMEVKGSQCASVTVLFPRGTYRIHDRLLFPATKSSHMRVVGEARDATIIRLVDSSPAFAEVARPRAVIAFVSYNGTWWSSNTSFGNEVENLTIDVGAGNPGAVGIDYHNNNTGHIEGVCVRSSDPQRLGAVGIRCPGGLSGIGTFRDIEIDGFDKAMTFLDRKIGYLLEDIRLRNQRVCGIETSRKPLWIRRLDSVNTVPAVAAMEDGTQIVLLDSSLTGGSPATCAIDLRHGQIFARQVRTAGYAGAISTPGATIAGPVIDEYASAHVSSDGVERRSIGLPIEDLPARPVLGAGAEVTIDGSTMADATAAIQAAINGGAQGVHVTGTLVISSTIVLRGPLARLTGTTAPGIGSLGDGGLVLDQGMRDRGDPAIIIDPGAAGLLWIERLGIHGLSAGNLAIRNDSPHTVVLRQMEGAPYRGQGGGRVFLDEVTNGVGSGAYEMVPQTSWTFSGQKVWARHLNPEGGYPHVINDGGDLVVLGGKFGEMHGPYIITRNGGRTEVLGAMFNALGTTGAKPFRSLVINDHSDVCVVAMEDNAVPGGPHPLAIREFGAEGSSAIPRQALLQVGGKDLAVMIPFYRRDLAVRGRGPLVAIRTRAGEAEEGAGDSLAVLEISRDGDLAQPLTVGIALGTETTADAADMDALPATITIPANADATTLTIMARDDQRHDGDKQLQIMLVGGAYLVDRRQEVAEVRLRDRAVDLNQGLQCRLDGASGAVVDSTTSAREMAAQRVESGPVDGRSAMRFVQGAMIRLGAETAKQGFMHDGFTSRSVALWARIEQSQDGTLFRQGGVAGMRLSLALDGTLHARVSAFGSLAVELATPWPADGGWHHVALVFNEGELQLFLDGIRSGGAVLAASTIPRHSYHGGFGMGEFRGWMAEPRIYDRALNHSEVQALARDAK